MSYTLQGPFNNGAAPAISATVMNNIDTWLASFFQSGQITKIAYGFTAVTTTGTTITHNLGVTPSCTLVTPTSLTSFSVTGYTSTQMIITVGTNCNAWWLVLA